MIESRSLPSYADLPVDERPATSIRSKEPENEMRARLRQYVPVC